MKKNDVDVFVLGINHKKTSIEVREKLVFRKDELSSSLQNLQSDPLVEEVLILSTCNRTEIYVTSCHHKLEPILKDFLKTTKGCCPEESLYFLESQRAVDHLLRVVSGLDSMILGETQILGQARDAFLAAQKEGSVGTILGRLMNLAFGTGKKVHSQTRLNAGAVSVAYAGVELAEKIFKDLTRHEVLLIGAGETGELTAKHLISKGIRKLYIANRTEEKARKLATQLGGESVALDQIKEYLSRVKIVIGAVSATEYILTYQDRSFFPSHPLLLIDLGVPRNFDPTLDKLDLLFLHSMDHLEQIISKNIDKRRDQIPQAEKIIQKEVDHFYFWKKSLSVTPTIVALQKKLEAIRQKELQRYIHQVEEEELKRLEKITHAMVGKILHSPLVNLKKYCNGTGDSLLKIDLVKELFELEIQDEK